MVTWTAWLVFVILFGLVTWLGFAAARWRRGDLGLLQEWGLAGRRFGTLIVWFLLGGDLYTAYTFVAVPGQIYSAGAIGFFAVPYTILIYPLAFVVLPRLWSVAKRHGYVTLADFVRGRYDSGPLALAVAFTGILATMPYIALQLVGIQAVLQAMGLTGGGWLLRDLPLIVAFGILAAYTYSSGLRAPAMIAVVKDGLIYLTVIVAVIVIPAKLGGFHAVFAAAAAAKKSVVLSPKLYTAFASLALGSALALFLYPHSVTGVLSAEDGRVIRRNAALLPAYSFLLGLIALLGFMAVAAGVQTKVPVQAVPLLFIRMFPSWFVGVAFAAIAIGALVPAAIMSIAAANLFTRNFYREYVNVRCSDAQETRIAKIVSLVVKIGAVAFIIGLPQKQALNLQLLGGIWMLQVLPTVLFGLYTRWMHRHALLAGWAVGMVAGTWMAATLHYQSSVYPLHLGGLTVAGYAGLYAVILNTGLAAALTWVFGAAKVARGSDATEPADYETVVAG